jgi:hypothetical protein
MRAVKRKSKKAASREAAARANAREKRLSSRQRKLNKRRAELWDLKRRRRPRHPLSAGSTPPAVLVQEPPETDRSGLSRGDAERLLWRAGFGPRPGDVEALRAKGSRTDAVRSLTRPSGRASLVGPAPSSEDGPTLDPINLNHHDHLQWLDRMVRSDQPLVERMALVWHDWFATSQLGGPSRRMMLEQIDLFRTMGLGSFAELVLEVTRGGAMLLWLNGWGNRKGVPNENYGREMMELFTLGADRGAYTEADVQQQARALTGFQRREPSPGIFEFYIASHEHDDGEKSIFGQTGRFDWRDACRVCIEHPMHPSFFVRKLWSYFVPTAPSEDAVRELEAVYVSSGTQILPVLEAILEHPDFYAAPQMVKPPVVYTAGMLRATAGAVDSNQWTALCLEMGQRLLQPPTVAGWDDEHWLDTGTMHGRWDTASRALVKRRARAEDHRVDESPAEAVERALAFWGCAEISGDSRKTLERFAVRATPNEMSLDSAADRARRQDALRHLIAVAPDYQVC